MTANLLAFGTIFSAYGCKFNYVSEYNELEVIDGLNSDVEAALADIELFEDTANHIDYAAALALSVRIDGETNPLALKTRTNILRALHVMKDNRFIRQVLSLQKNNRAWHVSEHPNLCSHFNEVCTHRGINPDPERKGKTSSRHPDEYHPLVARKVKKEVIHVVNREQLVTPALNNIFLNIPEDMLISGEKMFDVDDSIRQLRRLDLNERLRVISALQEVS